MTQDVTGTFTSEQIKLYGTTPIDMYVFNASMSGFEPYYFANFNVSIYGYELAASGEPTNNATLYGPGQIKGSNTTTSTTGELSTLDVTIPNTNRGIEPFIQNRNYLRGHEVFKLTYFGKHLPSGTGGYYIGDTPDYRSCLKEKFFIDSVNSNEAEITFHCKSKFDVRKVVLPRRSFTHECYWALDGNYLGSECDPAASVDSVTYTDCDGTLENCRERQNSHRFGGFPGIVRRSIMVRG